MNLGAGRTAKAVACGEYHTCAILDDDTLKCWGKNSNIGYGGGSMYTTAPQDDGCGEPGLRAHSEVSQLKVGTNTLA